MISNNSPERRLFKKVPAERKKRPLIYPRFSFFFFNLGWPCGATEEEPNFLALAFLQQ